jgi:hypothetical protein
VRKIDSFLQINARGVHGDTFIVLNAVQLP